jgi:hypothetical protein
MTRSLASRSTLLLVASVALLAGQRVAVAGASESARDAAHTYVSAFTHGRARTVCRYLAAAPRRELIREAGGKGSSVASCARAARKLLPKRLRHVRIVRVRAQSGVVTVTLSAPENSDSVFDSFRMKLRGGRWRVLDL